jgi:phage terminase large subunit-like protein
MNYPSKTNVPSLDFSQLSLPAAEKLLAEMTRDIEHADSRRKLWTYYPDAGDLRRELYPRHLDFFAAGAQYMERAFIAANRSGKSTCAGYELTLHLTGKYPDWWVGRRFNAPITAWACGVNIAAIRDSLQPLLLGMPKAPLGTGMIPGDDIVGTTAGRGVADAIDSFQVRHVSGGISRGVIKTYEQGRESFQAATIHVAWMDEEPPKPIYSETLTRLMSTVPGEENGLMMCTFTPLQGMSEVVMGFLGDDWRRPDANEVPA